MRDTHMGLNHGEKQVLGCIVFAFCISRGLFFFFFKILPFNRGYPGGWDVCWELRFMSFGLVDVAKTV